MREGPQLASALGSSWHWFLTHAGVKPKCIQRKYFGSPGFSRVMKFCHKTVVFIVICLSFSLVMNFAYKSSFMIESPCCLLSHHVLKLHAHSSAQGRHAWCLWKVGWIRSPGKIWEAKFAWRCRVILVQPGPCYKHDVWVLEREKTTQTWGSAPSGPLS